MPLTHAHKTALMRPDSCVMKNLRQLHLVIKAKNEWNEQQGQPVGQFSADVRRLLNDFYTPLNKHMRSEDHDRFTGALNRYEEEVRAIGHAHCDLIGELTGTGFFDFNDWLRLALNTRRCMILDDRQAPVLPQAWYARGKVAHNVMKLINEEVNEDEQ